MIQLSGRYNKVLTKKKNCCAQFASPLALSSPGSAWADHGDANRYDENVIVVKGTLVEVQMVNPRSLIVFDVTEPDGKRRQGAGVARSRHLAVFCRPFILSPG